MGRQQMYDVTGQGYEDNRYGMAHMRAYRDTRNEALLALITSAFGSDVPLRILEVGCGTGLTLDHISRLPVGHSLFGVDFSRTMLHQAREKATRLDTPPTLLLGDASRLSFSDDAFDVVYSTRFIHQFSHKAKRIIHNEFLRVTRRGGIVISEFYARHYHWLRYYLRHSKRSKKAFFSHYPTGSEVQEILGGPPQRLPVRIAGDRLFRRILGDEALMWMTKGAKYPPLSVLTDEYFVVARK